MISNGTYRAKADGQCVLGASKNKGTPFIELYFKITQGENAGEMVKWQGYFTDATSERTIQSLVTMGWKGDDLSEFEDGNLHGLDANEVDIVVELESYTNDAGEERKTPKVQWVNRAGGFLQVQNAMNSEGAKGFGARMRGLCVKVRANAPVQKQVESDADTSFDHGANVAPVEPAKRAF